MAKNFTSEDDLSTFEGWLKYQGVDAAAVAPDDLRGWRDHFEIIREHTLATPKLGRMKFPPMAAGEHRYAVAVRDDARLWLALWVKRTPKPEFFIMLPRPDRTWNPHTSYHLDGALHMKSFGSKPLHLTMRQPLRGSFHGTEHLGGYKGHGPKSVGAVCDPADFSGLVEVAPGVLGPRDGVILVDLVEPGCNPVPYEFGEIVKQQVFSDAVPSVVIRIVDDTPKAD